jgi:hypothetical protein
MRDFRDAKAMAHTLRAALTANDLKITISESLELITQAFGVADWNTLWPLSALKRQLRARPPHGRPRQLRKAWELQSFPRLPRLAGRRPGFPPSLS